MNINEQIINVAVNFLGQEEIRGNLGFKDPKFEQLMKNVGWQKTQAWCAYFAELVWKVAYSNQNSLIVPEIDKIFSGSAVQTMKNFKKAGWEIHRGISPQKGSLAVWQKFKNGKPHWSGHIGIYTENLSLKLFNSIDGNTNDDGSREGYEVAKKCRSYNYTSKSGLVLIGFIEPKKP